MFAVVAAAGAAYALWSAWDGQAVREWKEAAGPIPFFTAMALLPAIGLPLTPFYVLAGSAFGLRTGLLGSAAALVVNLTLCYTVARGALRPTFEALFRRSRYELPAFEEGDRRGLRFTIFVKMAPGVPAFVKNYMLGVAGVPMPAYYAVSLATTGVYGALLVVLGESILEHDFRQSAILVTVLVALSLAAWWWWRRRTRT